MGRERRIEDLEKNNGVSLTSGIQDSITHKSRTSKTPPLDMNYDVVTLRIKQLLRKIDGGIKISE